MATMWRLIEVCIADAARAEELFRDLGARRELRLDPDTALAGFSLWPDAVARDLSTVDARGERGRLVDPPGQVEEEDAA